MLAAFSTECQRVSADAAGKEKEKEKERKPASLHSELSELGIAGHHPTEVVTIMSRPRQG